jgi:hypothetical protein
LEVKLALSDSEQLAIYNALKLYIKKLRKELDLQLKDDWDRFRVSLVEHSMMIMEKIVKND